MSGSNPLQAASVAAPNANPLSAAPPNAPQPPPSMPSTSRLTPAEENLDRLRRAAQFAKSDIGWTTSQRKNAELAAQALQAHGFDAMTKNPSSTRTSKQFAAIGSPTNGILVNPSSFFWKDPVGAAKHSHEVGHLSSDDPKGVLLHEIAHTIYDPPGYWGAEPHKKIAAEVSRYAATNPKEFVSEVFAGLHTGKQFSPDVMRLFQDMSRRRHRES